MKKERKKEEMEELIPLVKDKINTLIKKPNMSEKLLMKPPFRFLHDTITAIIQTTGFADGLYSTEEMDSANINEKSAKITYLEKIFGVVAICHVSSFFFFFSILSFFLRHYFLICLHFYFIFIFILF